MLEPKHGGERAQCPVHSCTVGKDVQHFRIDHGDVSALSLSRRRDTSLCGGKVVLRSHRVAVVFSVVTVNLFLHNVSSRRTSRTSPKSGGCAVAARQTPRPAACADWTSRAQDTAKE